MPVAPPALFLTFSLSDLSTSEHSHHGALGFFSAVAGPGGDDPERRAAGARCATRCAADISFAEARVPPTARQDYVLTIARIRYHAKVRETRLPEVDRYFAQRL